MTTMRAKMSVGDVQYRHNFDKEKGVVGDISSMSIELYPVSGKYGDKGESEDNTFARFSPSGKLSLTITNPDLFHQIHSGQTYYLDFTEVA